MQLDANAELLVRQTIANVLKYQPQPVQIAENPLRKQIEKLTREQIQAILERMQ